MKRFIRFTGGALEAVEFVVFVCAATVFVVVGPVIWSYRLFTADHVVGAAVVAILWLASVITVALEVRRKAITAISLGVFIAWFLVLVGVFHDRLGMLAL